MNQKQWMLLITMSTVLLLSVGTIVMLIISGDDVTDREPSLSDQKFTEPAEPDQHDTEEADRQENPGEVKEKEGHNPDDGSGGTVSEWFEDEETEINIETDKKEAQDTLNREVEKNSTDTEIKFPVAPEEPEIQFEDTD